MAPEPRSLPAGIIFRRLDAGDDRRRAARLLADRAVDDHDGTCVWYGLCDLTAADDSGPAAVAVVRPCGSGAAVLCGLAVSTAYDGDRLGRRLLCEVADRLAADGVAEISARPGGNARVAALLAQAGFGAGEQPQGRGSGWLRLPL